MQLSLRCAVDGTRVPRPRFNRRAADIFTADPPGKGGPTFRKVSSSGVPRLEQLAAVRAAGNCRSHRDSLGARNRRIEAWCTERSCIVFEERARSRAGRGDARPPLSNSSIANKSELQLESASSYARITADPRAGEKTPSLKRCERVTTGTSNRRLLPLSEASTSTERVAREPRMAPCVALRRSRATLTGSGHSVALRGEKLGRDRRTAAKYCAPFSHAGVRVC